MAERYYKVAESELVKIADTIRLQKKSEKKYQLKDFAKVIGAMLVLPSGLAETEVTMHAVTTDAVGVLPTVYYGRASVSVTMHAVTTDAVGVLTE